MMRPISPPRVILARGPTRCTDPAALVVDHFGHCFWRDGAIVARAPPATFRLLAGLIARAPVRVLWPDLIEAMWGDRADGGVDDPRGQLKVLLSRSKPIQAALGGRVVNEHGRGLVFVFEAPAEPEAFRFGLPADGRPAWGGR